MESASKSIKRTLLELGGKSAMIVLDDADFPAAHVALANQLQKLHRIGARLTPSHPHQ